MKRICVTALALVMFTATSMAQEQPASVQWYAQHTMQTAYLNDAQSVFVQRKMARHHSLTTGVKMAVGVQHQQLLKQHYSSQADSSLAKGSFVSLMFSHGSSLATELISALQHDSDQGRIQQHQLAHTIDLQGPVMWQMGITHARMLDQQQSLDHWVMGFVWPGELETKLLLAHGDDVQHYGYQNDTRMTLGVEKVFGF